MKTIIGQALFDSCNDYEMSLNSFLCSTKYNNIQDWNNMRVKVINDMIFILESVLQSAGDQSSCEREKQKDSACQAITEEKRQRSV